MTDNGHGANKSSPTNNGSESHTDPPSIDLDGAFQILSNGRRRFVVRHLAEHDDGEGVSIGTLSRARAVEESNAKTEPHEINSTERQRVYIPLYQGHLPKMDEAGIVDYDKRRGQVHATEALFPLAELLSQGDEIVGQGVPA